MPALRPGPLNLITDVDGIAVGNAADEQTWTGTTVILPSHPAKAAADVRGGAPGTRETEALQAGTLIDNLHAVVLSGGSVFGLEAASGVTAHLAANGIGLLIGGVRVPIVPSAVLFDLTNGGDRSGALSYRDLGIRACLAAGGQFPLGNVGAGYGAGAGSLKGGLGSASTIGDNGLQVGAIVAVNSFGSAVMPGQATLWAWALEQDGELGGQPLPTHTVALDAEIGFDYPDLARSMNTTIGVVATNAALSRAELQRVAIMAQDGYPRAIRPIHTPFDGDVVFALATGGWEPPEGRRASTVGRIGSIAADCMARAVARAVYEARALGSMPAYRDLHGAALRGAGLG